MDGRRFDALHRHLSSGRRGMVAGAIVLLTATLAPPIPASVAKNKNKNKKNNGKNGKGGTCTCCPGGLVYFPEADICCPKNQTPIGGVCCSPQNICNNNQGQPVCCPFACLGGVCCPCDNIANCQQCVVDVGQNPPQASCQNYCAQGQYCTPGGCAAPVG